MRITTCQIALFWIAGFVSNPLPGTEIEWSNHPAAERISLHLNGLSYHFSTDRNKLNEFNRGLGLSYYVGQLKSEFRVLNDFKVFAEVDGYSDSFSNFGYLFAASFQRSLRKPLDWGLGIGFVHEDKLARDTGYYLHPYVFPYLQTDFDFPVNARIFFIPPVHNQGIIAFQLMMDFGGKRKRDGRRKR